MANSWVTIPNTFAGQSGNVAVSQLDTDLSNIATGTPCTFQGSSRLTFVSATQIQLGLGVIPLLVSGNWIMRPVTTALTIANTGLVSATTYFVYVFDSAGVATLEFSTTGHATNTVFGLEQKSGDATRTLVGMIRTNATGNFADSPTQRFTISHFARRAIGAINFFTAVRTTASVTYVELNTEIRTEFVTWADEAPTASFAGLAFNDTLSQSSFTTLGLDGVTAQEGGSAFQAAVASSYLAVAGGTTKPLAEGYHFYTLLGRVSAGTGSWYGTATVGERCTVSVALRG